MPKWLEERPGHCARRHPRGRLAGAGALQDVPHVVELVLQRAGHVGVARPNPGDLARRLERAVAGIDRLLDVHPPDPVRRVQVRDHHRERASEGVARGERQQRTGPCPARSSPATTSVAALPPPQLLVHVGGRDLQPGRQVLHHDRELLAVALPGRQERLAPSSPSGWVHSFVSGLQSLPSRRPRGPAARTPGRRPPRSPGRSRRRPRRPVRRPPGSLRADDPLVSHRWPLRAQRRPAPAGRPGSSSTWPPSRVSSRPRLAMRSLSLTRSSAASRISVTPSANSPMMATSGSSSMARGTTSPPTLTPSQAAAARH